MFEELLQDPIMNMGFGLLVSKDLNSGLANGMTMMHQTQKAKADEEDRLYRRERDKRQDDLATILAQYKLASLSQPKLSTQVLPDGNIALVNKANGTYSLAQPEGMPSAPAPQGGYMPPMPGAGGAMDGGTGGGMGPRVQPAPTGLPPKAANTYYEKQAANFADQQNEIMTNAEGAIGFLSKLDTLDQNLKNLGQGVGGLEGSEWFQGLSRMTGIDGEDQTKRDAVNSTLADLQLDVAKVKLKGQGTVTDTERTLAKGTLPRLDVDPAANEVTRQSLIGESLKALKRARETGLYPQGVTPENVDSLITKYENISNENVTTEAGGQDDVSALTKRRDELLRLREEQMKNGAYPAVSY